MAEALQIAHKPLRYRAKRTPKFIQGEAFETLPQLLRWLKQGRWVYMHNRPVHPAWVLNMSAGYLDRAKSSIRHAELNPDWVTEARQTLESYNYDVKAGVRNG